ncbi:MAG: ATPase of the AAA+ class [Haloquadratum walsbyi J07HQW1]|uniref:ATPase of the AAA+ class n=1 Tax=Haloquadratum walsbyi J07HQW1 TaxID=1238424 RepID=U1PAW4_9EURY|nr:MAG: ATPase of the AAA+ class [Haloquadratum walsbyi J07HQW1]
MSSTLNLDPLTKTDRPTSHITVQKRKIGPTDLIAVEHGTTKAYFRVDREQEVMSNDLRNAVYLHENAAAVFGGIDHSLPFRIHTDVRTSEVPTCDEAVIATDNSDSDRLSAHLASERFLLHHGIEEVTRLDGQLVSFDVVETVPQGYTTVMVTDETEISVIDESEAATRKSQPGGTRDTPGRATPAGPGDNPPPGASDAGEMDVDIDISPEKPTVSFEEDVAGLEEVKQTARMLLALFDPETRESVIKRYGENFGARGGQLLLYGPPGCGKTLVSEAIAYEAANNTNIESEYGEVQFLPVKGGDILSRYPGEAERRVEAVFEEAHRAAQNGFAVLFFDEVETLVADRSDDNLQRHERSLTNAFLQEMGTDKIEDNLLVIGATNMPFSIDPAAARRFPLQQFIPQPGPEVMGEVWEAELSDLQAANDAVELDYDRLGEASVGYTPAEIADRVLGTDLQRELIQSVVDTDANAIVPDTKYFLERLREHRPKTIRQFVTSVRNEADALEGYPEMRDYVADQADRLGLSMQHGSTAGMSDAATDSSALFEQLVAAGEQSTGDTDNSSESPSDTER